MSAGDSHALPPAGWDTNSRPTAKCNECGNKLTTDRSPAWVTPCKRHICRLCDGSRSALSSAHFETCNASSCKRLRQSTQPSVSHRDTRAETANVVADHAPNRATRDRPAASRTVTSTPSSDSVALSRSLSSPRPGGTPAPSLDTHPDGPSRLRLLLGSSRSSSSADSAAKNPAHSGRQVLNHQSSLPERSPRRGSTSGPSQNKKRRLQERAMTEDSQDEEPPEEEIEADRVPDDDDGDDDDYMSADARLAERIWPYLKGHIDALRESDRCRCIYQGDDSVDPVMYHQTKNARPGSIGPDDFAPQRRASARYSDTLGAPSRPGLSAPAGRREKKRRRGRTSSTRTEEHEEAQRGSRLFDTADRTSVHDEASHNDFFHESEELSMAPPPRPAINYRMGSVSEFARRPLPPPEPSHARLARLSSATRNWGGELSTPSSRRGTVGHDDSHRTGHLAHRAAAIREFNNDRGPRFIYNDRDLFSTPTNEEENDLEMGED